MKPTYKLFRLFVPLICIVTALATIIGIFMFSFNYRYDALHTKGINFQQAAPILMFALMGISICLLVTFLVKVKHTHITKLRRDSNILKFASALAFVVILILTVYDLYVLLASNASLSAAKTFKVLRLLAAVPFLGYIVINVLPKRMFKRRFYIPEAAVNICAIGAVVWALCGLLAIWFFEGNGYQYFKVIHTLFYVLYTFYIICEIKTQLLKPSVKLHVFSALLLFTVSFVLTASAVVASFTANIAGNPISNFEMVTAIALTLYALSKVFAYQHTLKFLLSSGTSGRKHRHHHHHHHHHSESTENAVSGESNTTTDVIDNTQEVENDVVKAEETAAEVTEAKTSAKVITPPYQKEKNYPKGKGSNKKKKKK